MFECQECGIYLLGLAPDESPVRADSVEKVDDHDFTAGFVGFDSCVLENLDFYPLQSHCVKSNSRISAWNLSVAFVQRNRPPLLIIRLERSFQPVVHSFAKIESVLR